MRARRDTSAAALKDAADRVEAAGALIPGPRHRPDRFSVPLPGAGRVSLLEVGRGQDPFLAWLRHRFLAAASPSMTILFRIARGEMTNIDPFGRLHKLDPRNAARTRVRR